MTTAVDGEPAENTGANGRSRSHWTLPWALMLLALPGAGWSLYVAALSAASLFGEAPSAVDRATSTAAYLSGASLWLVTGVLTVVISRRVTVPVLCVLASAGFAMVSAGSRPRAPLGAADSAGFLAAWLPPTSWVLAVWAVCAVLVFPARRAQLRVRHRRRQPTPG